MHGFLAVTAIACLLGGEPQENLIAPLPAAALVSTKIIEGKMTTFDGTPGTRPGPRSQAPTVVTLKPHQSLMGVIQAENPALFQVRFTNKFFKPIVGVRVTRVGGKVFILNRRHVEMEVVCLVSGSESMTNEPYKLVLCEINTDIALGKKAD